MKPNQKPMSIPWSAADRARHRAIREWFQRERPSPEQLVAGGEYSEPVLNSHYFELRKAMAVLRKARQEAGLSLADIARRSGIGKAALSRLETGRLINPTLNTLYRYAATLGKTLRLTTDEIGTKAFARNGPSRHKKARRPRPTKT